MAALCNDPKAIQEAGRDVSLLPMLPLGNDFSSAVDLDCAVPADCYSGDRWVWL